MSRWMFLSWELHDSTPLYPGTNSVEIRPVRQISAGDTCNTSTVLTSSHAGTHVDTPLHFVANGSTLSDYSADDFIFGRPCLIDCPKPPGGVITVTDLESHTHIADADILLIKTGFQQYRQDNPELYSKQNPCLAPDAATWLRKTLPSVRAIGIDCISISSPLHRDIGRAAHLALLGQCDGAGAPLLIIEDMMLPENGRPLAEVIVLPLRLQGGDGAPCTVIGRFRDA